MKSNITESEPIRSFLITFNDDKKYLDKIHLFITLGFKNLKKGTTLFFCLIRLYPDLNEP